MNQLIVIKLIYIPAAPNFSYKTSKKAKGQAALSVVDHCDRDRY